MYRLLYLPMKVSKSKAWDKGDNSLSDIGLHYSSVTDYLDAVVGYDKGMMSY